ncbi:uncharacterized protein UV8b_05381 [Ustilaginoidea virens]|uniref:Xylanolytic transcriptional activator regulatory domain-containing protein n=1 Tax=Ustilaginoidea virens TaxID=1159556 RepID=A0A8E5MI18_USTVR|nr:uncharacterized protein UV8b_05381 [Ustilaginoidea virens]QUC21138.1 hypothetical protein UV8b_05381 [Ustilaginoidea virens]
MPCGRCVKNKRAPQCIYADADSSPAVEPPTSEKEQDPLSVIATSFINSQWNPLVQNGSHWHSLLQQMENYLPQWPSQRTGPSLQQEKPVSRMVPTINYPFNGDTVGRGAIVRVLAQLPPRPVQELFVSYYLNSVEKTYHLLHLEEFDRELQEFWEDPAAKAEDWLAQYFVILGLGCQAMNYCSEESGNEAHRSMPTGFLRSAELCLKRTPYMLMTSLANVRTLIMIVMSKQMYAMSYHEADTCWPLTGLIVRLSIRMGLHRAAWKPYTQRSHEEKVKSQVWAVVLVLEMRQSLVCGMPLLLRAADISSVESNTSQTPSTGNTTLGDSRIDYGSFGNKDPIILTRLLAVSDDDLLFRAIELATSPMGGTPYSDVAAVDTSLRDKLYQSGIGLANSHLEADKPAKDIDLEVCMVQIFFRQVFMALHARFSLQPNASTEHPVSYVSSLESALAILAYQRGLCEGEKWAELSAWFAGFFRHEFFMAAMTVCSLLIRDLESTAVSSHTGFCETQPRKIMLDALQSCRDMWKKEKTWSVCNANAFALVDNLVCVLRHAHEQGCSIPL